MDEERSLPPPAPGPDGDVEVSVAITKKPEPQAIERTPTIKDYIVSPKLAPRCNFGSPSPPYLCVGRNSYLTRIISPRAARLLVCHILGFRRLCCRPFGLNWSRRHPASDECRFWYVLFWDPSQLSHWLIVV